MEEREKMKDLINRLNAARAAYYNGQEIMSNFEYDNLYDELEKMERETGQILQGSPTQSVGFVPAAKELKKVRHEYPALSLAKTKDIDEFVENFNLSKEERSVPIDTSWSTVLTDGRCIHPNTVMLMWKLDGSTCQITVDEKDGKEQIVLAATRGNGEVGSDITHNLHAVYGIPEKIPGQLPTT